MRTGDRTQERPGGGPLVSIIIPSLNRGAHIRTAIDSVLAQDYPHVECIVVDGGSTDRTGEVLAGYGDRIRWVSEPDDGPYDAINKGFGMARGEVLAWLNDDDRYRRGAISLAVQRLREHPGASVIYGVCVEHAARHGRSWAWGYLPWDYEQSVLNASCVIAQPAAFMRREIVERVGGLAKSAVHDFDLWLRIAEAGGTLAAAGDYLADAEDHAARITNQPARMVPAVVAAITRALDRPEAPLLFQTMRKRALSAAWAHCLYVARDRQWRWFGRCLVESIRIDPSNTGHVLRSATRIIAYEPGVAAPARLLARGVLAAFDHARGVTRIALTILLALTLRELRQANRRHGRA